MPRRSDRLAKMPQPQAVNIAAYVRVSTEEQAESGLGLDAQRSRCSAICQAKGWPEPTFYVDEGISGVKSLDKRPALQRLMDDAQSGLVDVLVISSLDRLGRRLVIVLNLVEELCYHNQVALVSCKESFDTSTPQGTFVMHMFVAMAELERGMISQRTREALAEREKRDGEHGGGLPYGYMRTPYVEEDPNTGPIVRKVFALRKKGLTLRAIGDAVDKAHTSVAEILNNEAIYRGGKRGNSDTHWPVILHR